ncbi:hypothetical protein KUCAC02_035031, partial [Chaenocephalus aceratus]
RAAALQSLTLTLPSGPMATDMCAEKRCRLKKLPSREQLLDEERWQLSLAGLT